MLRELDTVVLAHDLEANGLTQGDVGAVLTWLRILAAVRDHQAPQQASAKIYDRVSQISRRLSAYFHGHSFARRTEEL